jgi:hypothetical protein
MNNLAGGYQFAGRPHDALPLLKETLKLRRAKLGPDHAHMVPIGLRQSAHSTRGSLNSHTSRTECQSTSAATQTSASNPLSPYMGRGPLPRLFNSRIPWSRVVAFMSLPMRQGTTV